VQAFGRGGTIPWIDHSSANVNFYYFYGTHRYELTAAFQHLELQLTTRILERQNVLQTSQVLFRRLCVGLAVVLPFKDSEGGTWLLDLFDFNWRYIWTHAPLKKAQYANHAKAFAPDQNFGPAISEAAEPRCATPSAIKLPDTLRWSEARPR
jgi:hypothetical protein